MSFKSAVLLIVVAVLVVFACAPTVQGQVAVVRGGEENPMVTIAKSTLYGAGTGLVVGLALSLVIDEPFEDVMKWSFVGGTLGGLAIGILHVATRPNPQPFIHFDGSGGARLQLPEARIARRHGAWSVHVPVASVGF